MRIKKEQLDQLLQEYRESVNYQEYENEANRIAKRSFIYGKLDSSIKLIQTFRLKSNKEQSEKMFWQHYIVPRRCFIAWIYMSKSALYFDNLYDYMEDIKSMHENENTIRHQLSLLGFRWRFKRAKTLKSIFGLPHDFHKNTDLLMTEEQEFLGIFHNVDVSVSLKIDKNIANRLQEVLSIIDDTDNPLEEIQNMGLTPIEIQQIIRYLRKNN